MAGGTWNPPTSKAALKVSPSGGSTQFPVMISADGYQNVSKGDVYVAWSQTVSGILQAFVGVSNDNGTSFKATQLSQLGGITPSIAAWGHDAYVSWYQNSNCPNLNGSGCLWVSSSTNDGAMWSAPLLLTKSSGGEEQLVASNHTAYFIADGVYFSATYNDGLNWTAPIVLYGIYLYGSGCPTLSSPCVYSFGREPWIAASGSNVYVTFNAIDLASPPNASGLGSSNPIYRIYGLTSNDNGSTWYSGNSTNPSHQLTTFPPVVTTPADQQKFLMSGAIKSDWEPENIAFGNNAVLTFHSVGNQGIYMMNTTNAGVSWVARILLTRRDAIALTPMFSPRMECMFS